MKSAKALGLLILLLISGSGFSFSTESSIGNSVSQDHLTSNFTEGQDLIFVNNLSAQIHSGKISIHSTRRDFGIPSSHWTGIANEYFSHSTLIDPGLGIAKIIFPFHSFL